MLNGDNEIFGKMGRWENGRSELTQVMCFGKGVRGAFNGKEMRVSDFRLKNLELIKTTRKF